MPSKLLFLFVALYLTLCLTPASAQIYQWKDKDGRTVISDKPPPGQRIQRHRPEISDDSETPETPTPAPAATTPQSPSWADREQEFRKRQVEAREKAEKAAKEESAASTRNENCKSARRWLQTLESGQRVSTTSDDGKRQFMDDTQRQQEMEKMRSTVATQCQ